MSSLMEQDYKKEMEESIDELECPKVLKCYKSGFENLCSSGICVEMRG